MSTTLLRAAAAGLFVLIVFVSGYRLNRSGRPFNGLLLNVHKLVALAAGILLAIVLFQTNQAVGLDPLEWAVGMLSGALLLATGITGGLVSARPQPASLAAVHRITPFLAVLSAAITLYLLPAA